MSRFPCIRDVAVKIDALIRTNPAAAAAIAIAAGAAATILGAWFFEYGLGLKPCPLCLDQRVPYYVAIPLAAVVAAAALRSAPRGTIVAGLGLLAVIMAISAGLGAYHSGIEWKWWAGPRDCSGPLDSLGSTKDLLQDLATMSPVRCDQAAWRFLGLSLAGWNAIISLGLVLVAMWGILASAMVPAARATRSA
jgi:disulfide bond formation protein DsbB